MSMNAKASYSVVVAAVFALYVPVCLAQTSSSVNGASYAAEDSIQLGVTAKDQPIAGSVVKRAAHTFGTRDQNGQRTAPLNLETNDSGNFVRRPARSASGPNPNPFAPPNALGLPPPGYYPADLSLLTPGAPTISSASINNLYVNCTASCFGQPSTFLIRLFNSEFIHVVDQYLGSAEEGSYRLGRSAIINYPIPSTPLTDTADIYAILHAGAAQLGSGFNHIYNIFIPKGVDVCFDSTYSVCFSPDNWTAWSFCAYHGYADYPDIGHVLYTVQPYPDVFAINPTTGLADYGCDVGQPPPFSTNTAPTPNGVVVDTVASLLSHETFETITDPDLNAWQTQYMLSFSGYEIGDICVDYTFDYNPFAVSGHPYEIQYEYSDHYHACVTAP
jgi:hypothetical protein